MPTEAMALENMTKHLGGEEYQAGQQAEAETLPKRERVKLKPPAYVRSDKAAFRYWKQTLRRMEGITLLDDLDTEMLAVYCSQLSRWDCLNAERLELQEKLSEEKDAALLAKSLAGVSDELRKLESNLLSYSDKLGFNPSGRVRLARRRADERMIDNVYPLFGD